MEPIPYRIRIGVTGHRVLQDEEQIKKQIIEALKTKVTELFKDDSLALLNREVITPITYSVMTPLAEGADRLVAETILEYDNNSNVEVILPLTLSDYKKTFNNPDDPGFKNLYDKARYIKQLRMLDLEDDPDILNGDQKIPIETRIDESKKDAFETVGRYIVNRCDVLIAIWDGKESRGRGGTQEIIDYAVTKKRPVIIVPTNAPDKIETKDGAGLNGEAFKHIDKYNNYKVSENDKSDYIASLEEMFFLPENAKCLSDESKKQEIRNLFPYYATSSLRAKRSKKIYKPTGNLIYICSALAIISVLFGLLYPPAFLGAFVVEFVCLVVILLVYFFAQKYHQRWLENRFLTERFRAACYFILCGFKVNSIDIPPHMGIAHKSNDWMVQVFNEVWEKLPKLSRISEKELACCKNYIITHWINEQAAYHESKATKMKKANKKFKAFGWIIFTIALLASGIHIVHELLGGLESHTIIENILLFLAIALPAIGAAVVAIRKHGEYERIETRSRHISSVIQDLKVDIEQVRDVDEFERILNEFDELMLRENQDWLMLMKLVKLEVYP